MRRASILFLLFATSCSVPSLVELNSDCDKKLDPTHLFEGGPAHAVLGDGSGCRVVTTTTALIGFTPGCVQFRAMDSMSGEEFVAELTGLRESQVTDLRVAFLPPDSWGPEFSVTVRSFEQSCNGVQIGLLLRGVTARAGQVVPVSLALDGRDADNDGFVARTFGGSDCQDDSPTIFPGAPELCNALDDDCDGTIDEGFSSSDTAASGRLAYRDDDGDGYGAGVGLAVCGEPPSGYVLNNQDCNDLWATVYPGAVEICDGQDNNCNEDTDEAFPNLGTACMDANSQCMGVYQCAPQGDSTLCVASTPGPC